MPLLLIVLALQVDGYTIPANRPASARISTTHTFAVSNVEETRTVTHLAADGSSYKTEGTRMRSSRA